MLKTTVSHRTQRNERLEKELENTNAQRKVWQWFGRELFACLSELCKAIFYLQFFLAKSTEPQAAEAKAAEYKRVAQAAGASEVSGKAASGVSLLGNMLGRTAICSQEASGGGEKEQKPTTSEELRAALQAALDAPI